MFRTSKISCYAQVNYNVCVAKKQEERGQEMALHKFNKGLAGQMKMWYN